MRFYTQTQKHYCGVDLHARTMYVCVQNREGNVILHRELQCDAQVFLRAIQPFRDDLVVGVECIFTWYWLADLCARKGIAFVLAHALYLKSIHGAKAKNDRIDSQKLAALLRGGLMPQAYVYPAEMRATRDLMRRRLHFVRLRAQLLAHVQMTCHQYNRESPGKRIGYASNREALSEGFADVSVQESIAADLELIKHYEMVIGEVAPAVVRRARGHDPNAFQLLRTIPGVGKILAHLQTKHGKAKALSILAHRLGRAVYFMLARKRAFDLERFLRN
jgi:transposase